MKKDELVIKSTIKILIFQYTPKRAFCQMKVPIFG